MEATAVHTLSVSQLILEATLPVQLIMLLLVALSLVSWTHILNKWWTLRHARQALEAFEYEFWSGANLSQMYKNLADREDVTGLAGIFKAGFGEFLRLRQSRLEVADVMDGTRRAMNASEQSELDGLERHIAFLGTVGSISPYIGLLGTVWGIMHAFLGLGAAGTATLATVAPGIAEALIATAIGLFAAIPAVVGYNRFSHDIDRMMLHFDTFIEEFSNILQRQATK